MEAEMSNMVFAGETASRTGVDRDGISEQVVLLNELSAKLDEYFALRTFGPQETQDW